MRELSEREQQGDYNGQEYWVDQIVYIFHWVKNANHGTPYGHYQIWTYQKIQSHLEGEICLEGNQEP